MREIIHLQCKACKRRNYSTTKNKRKAQGGKWEFRKYCPFCRSHQPHKETR